MRSTIAAIAALALCVLSATASAQLKYAAKPAVSAAEKGKVFEINVRLETEGAIDSVLVVPLPSENFCVRSVAVFGVPDFVANSDGSAFLRSLPAKSAVTFQFKVAAPTQLSWSGSSCSVLDSAAAAGRRSPDNTRDNRIFVFNGRYRMLGADTTIHVWTESVEIKYTTSQGIFLAAGMIGVFLGYVVKSLTARRTDVTIAANQPTAKEHWKITKVLGYMFFDSIDKLVTSLVLGFGALLGMAKAGIPVGGFAVAIFLGIGIGVLADDTLISKVKTSP
jgi:hypothetical protein